MPSSLDRIDRRRFLALAGMSWLAPIGHLLARQAEATRAPARSVILLWLGGGPSQLETFDPHPNARIAAGTRAVRSNVKGIQLAEGLPQVAEHVDKLAIVRSLVSPEGDHERGTYMMKTGYRPDPTVEHPTIGAICCHEFPVGRAELPRHISILTGRWPSRGGFLGAEYDAFQVEDPRARLPDITSPVGPERDAERLRGLDVVERAFARGRARQVELTFHRQTLARARTMMSSEQIAAFDVSHEPARLQADYGDSPFGRGCLAARRLIEVGARCVEVTLDGWDAHVNNHEAHARLNRQLDPAFATLLKDLHDRGLLERTLVVCAGEFGRTPKLNLAGGRDHWPNGFSMVLAGGGLRAGIALGTTDPTGADGPADPTSIEDVHATILTALGIDPATENIAVATGRPIKLSAGKPIPALLASSGLNQRPGHRRG